MARRPSERAGPWLSGRQDFRGTAGPGAGVGAGSRDMWVRTHAVHVKLIGFTQTELQKLTWGEEVMCVTEKRVCSGRNEKGAP